MTGKEGSRSFRKAEKLRKRRARLQARLQSDSEETKKNNKLENKTESSMKNKTPIQAKPEKVSKNKKEKKDTPRLEREDSGRKSLKKASSTPVINGEEDEKVSQKLLRALKGGSFRSTMRGSKNRPSILPNGSGNSPYVAGNNEDTVKLTSIKNGKDKEKSLSTESLSSQSKPPKPSTVVTEKTPKLSNKKSPKLVTPKSETSTNKKQKKPLPPLPITSFEETPKTRLKIENGLGTSRKSASKRELDDSQASFSASKKRRVSSPKVAPKVLPVQPVTPQKKDKSNKKVWQSAPLEHMYDSQEEASKMFECMIHPVSVDKFFRELWQRKPLLVRRHIPGYNDGWFSTEELDRILTEEHIEFGVNLDVTSYKNGKRETHNQPGRAHRSVIWDHYQTGCSIRMLNPQTYSKKVWQMLSILQEYFGCCVGANIYLTPPGTQGFAPHYDDIEAFILQLEGKKHWRVYNPKSEEETLPRTSSGNFDESEIGDEILDITLQAGDLLYFPRGFIHQGNALEDAHSLHITVSCYQKNTWGDLLEKMVPRALEIAMEDDLEFRQGLPKDYLNYMGLVNSDVESLKREEFVQKITSLMTKMIQNYLPVDAACDQQGKQYIHDSLPPSLTEGERSCSIHGHGEKWDPASMCVKDTTEMEPDTMIKLIRKGCIRMITEEDQVRVYYNLENARVYHGREPQYIGISADLAPAVECLLHNYPEYVKVDELPLPTLPERLEIATILYDRGLLVTGEPLDTLDNDDEVESLPEDS